MGQGSWYCAAGGLGLAIGQRAVGLIEQTGKKRVRYKVSTLEGFARPGALVGRYYSLDQSIQELLKATNIEAPPLPEELRLWVTGTVKP